MTKLSQGRWPTFSHNQLNSIVNCICIHSIHNKQDSKWGACVKEPARAGQVHRTHVVSFEMQGWLTSLPPCWTTTTRAAAAALCTLRLYTHSLSLVNLFIAHSWSSLKDNIFFSFFCFLSLFLSFSIVLLHLLSFFQTAFFFLSVSQGFYSLCLFLLRIHLLCFVTLFLPLTSYISLLSLLSILSLYLLYLFVFLYSFSLLLAIIVLSISISLLSHSLFIFTFSQSLTFLLSSLIIS